MTLEGQIKKLAYAVQKKNPDHIHATYILSFPGFLFGFFACCSSLASSPLRFPQEPFSLFFFGFRIACFLHLDHVNCR